MENTTISSPGRFARGSVLLSQAMDVEIRGLARLDSN
jgi:hypothetical protein